VIRRRGRCIQMFQKPHQGLSLGKSSGQWTDTAKTAL
jgi:hypothetical protein